MSFWNWHSLLLTLALLALLGAIAPSVEAQPTSAPSVPDRPPMKAEELQQLLAPIALYPDSLLTQMLMASTYPLEIVEADRWAKEHKDLKGDALTAELEKQPWDPSIKSLINFPDQLAMMNDKLDLTIKLGDAFIGQQADVMNTIQVLRNKADAQGNLQSNDKQTVKTEAAPTTATATNTTTVNVQGSTGSSAAQTIVQAPPQVITIESPEPDVVYVPSYNPTVVYGGWPYPAYPPAPYYPAGYVATAAVSFGVGVACGAAWGYAWGHSNWGGGDVDIDVNRNANFNRNINRSSYQGNFQNRTNNFQGGRGNWQHNPTHRDGVAYRDQKTSQRYGGANSSAQAAKAREQYRGRTDSGRQELNRSAADQFKSSGANNRAGGANTLGDRSSAGTAARNPNAGSQNRGSAGSAAQNRSSAGSAAQNRSSAGAAAQNRSGNTANRSGSTGNRSSSSSSRGGAFNGVNRGGSGARADSQRGQSSRGSRSAPSRSSGGGRSGGGARGGGGRGGGRR